MNKSWSLVFGNCPWRVLILFAHHLVGSFQRSRGMWFFASKLLSFERVQFLETRQTFLESQMSRVLEGVGLAFDHGVLEFLWNQSLMSTSVLFFQIP